MDRPLSKTEMKILVYNRVRRGVPYSEAVEQVAEEVKLMNGVREEKKKAKRWKKDN